MGRDSEAHMERIYKTELHDADVIGITRDVKEKSLKLNLSLANNANALIIFTAVHTWSVWCDEPKN